MTEEQRDLPRDIGGFIRDLRRNARISLRQLADQAGVSNPYLSQIERGLRKPSAEVLAQLAHALRVSTPAMYLKAGLLDDKDNPGVLAAVAADPELTVAQKQSLTQIYETFRRENARGNEDAGKAGGVADRANARGTSDRENARDAEDDVKAGSRQTDGNAALRNAAKRSSGEDSGGSGNDPSNSGTAGIDGARKTAARGKDSPRGKDSQSVET